MSIPTWNKSEYVTYIASPPLQRVTEPPSDNPFLQHIILSFFRQSVCMKKRRKPCGSALFIFCLDFLQLCNPKRITFCRISCWTFQLCRQLPEAVSGCLCRRDGIWSKLRLWFRPLWNLLQIHCRSYILLLPVCIRDGYLRAFSFTSFFVFVDQ